MSPDEIMQAIEEIRNIDCLELHFCYKPHGVSVSSYLGESSSRRIIYTGDSLSEVIKKTLDYAKRKIIHTQQVSAADLAIKPPSC